ncbi:hypothetical protein [Micromonospora sp. NBRC 101691]|uniref:hypothetical protein n=1 Tax=Micromonospora sp. NBRC 101691 TaxID=3032198 RepID=UPI0024A56875|nr:hypothetical protein [Micromonospora sp. NBRC 101691]GLY24198.1 hypothetical protein Misp04_39300 [Micromonospora sp. NBRC 101691]
METLTYGQVLARFGLVVAVPEGRRTRYGLADARLAHALGDLLGLVLAVDPVACPDSDEKGCC